MSTSLQKRAAALEREVKERAEAVKKSLREYRESARRMTAGPASRTRARLLKKQMAVEQANAEYIRLRKELEHLRRRMGAEE